MTNNQEREARYAEAMDLTNPTLREHWSRRIRAVMAVADAEQAELVARLDAVRLTRNYFGEQAAENGARAEAAEAELAALRGQIEALADEWARLPLGQVIDVECEVLEPLRAALAASPAEDTTPAAPHAEDGERPHPNCYDDRCAGKPPCLGCVNRSAPVADPSATPDLLAALQQSLAKARQDRPVTDPSGDTEGGQA